MASLNKVFLIGRLTADPQLRYTPGGQAVCDIRFAVNSSYKTKTGETKEEATFVNITVWGRSAEMCAEYLKKGRQAFVEGRLKMDSWKTQEGQNRTKLSIVAQSVQFLDAKGGSGSAPIPATDSGPSDDTPMPDNIDDAPADKPGEEVPF